MKFIEQRRYLCTSTLYMKTEMNEVAFTEGKYYTCIDTEDYGLHNAYACFVDDRGKDHFISENNWGKYFEPEYGEVFKDLEGVWA